MRTAISIRRGAFRGLAGRTQEIYDRLRPDVVKMFPGAPLDSIRSLQLRYSAGQSTVVKAIKVLEKEGLLIRKPRKGVFVSDVGLKPADSIPTERRDYPAWVSVPHDRIVLAVADGSELSLWAELINVFNKSRVSLPLILKSLSLEDILRMGAGNDVPDMVAFSSHFVMSDPRFHSLQWMDLTPFIRGLKADDYHTKAFVQDPEGRIWGIGPYISSSMVFFNRAMARSAGVTVSAGKWTWEDLFQAACAMKRQRRVKAGPFWGYVAMGYMNYLLHRGIAFVDETGRLELDTPAMKQAVGLLRKMIGQEKVTPFWSDIRRNYTPWRGFEGGAIGMFEGYSNVNPPFGSRVEVGVAPLPLNDGGMHGLSVPPVCLSSACLNAQESWEFLRFVLSEEGQRIVASHTGSLPVRKEVAPKGVSAECIRVQTQAVETGNLHYLKHPELFPVRGIIESAIEKWLKLGGDLSGILKEAEMICRWQIDKNRGRP